MSNWASRIGGRRADGFSFLQMTAPVDFPAMGHGQAKAMPGSRGFGEPRHGIAWGGDHFLGGFAGVPDPHAAPDVADAGDHSVGADVVVRAEQPTVGPLDWRKGALQGGDRLGKA